MYRSSHQRCFVKKVLLKNFSKFTGKHLSQSLYFNKVARRRPATLLKKRLWHRCFPVNFAKSLRTPSLIEHLRCCFCMQTIKMTRPLQLHAFLAFNIKYVRVLLTLFEVDVNSSDSMASSLMSFWCLFS